MVCDTANSPGKKNSPGPAISAADRAKQPLASYDPELLYVECRACGKPVLWESGKTTELLLAAGVDISRLDERCLILSEGCPACRPQEERGFTLAVLRIADLTVEEAVYMDRPAGNA
ncbi:MAG: hypothetical protein LBJ82_00240 [Deltaproteobacteria bacterium]|jgi:hypothetical protein|nr:hypothetical protein [Deltaproteobacteria bacterium]